MTTTSITHRALTGPDCNAHTETLTCPARMTRLLALVGILFTIVGTAHGDNWFRGNTHTHTVICGHADSTPEYVAGWYLDRGYHFLILSEHNHFIDPDSVALPENRRRDFILIPGEEDSGPRHIHSTAMNTRHRVDWDFDSDHRHEIIQKQVDGARAAGGHTILNHPNWQWALTADDVFPVRQLHLFELHNGHPSVNNWGDADHPSTEQMWDDLLTRGMLIYGVSSDDAHTFQTLTRRASNPGRGWVMVRADTLTADAITQAMQAGEFYASSGVFLHSLERGPELYAIRVDVTATMNEVGKWEVLGHQVDAGVTGFRIDILGPGGVNLATAAGSALEYRIRADDDYVRARITFTRALPDGGFERYYAWTQPFFSDERQTR